MIEQPAPVAWKESEPTPELDLPPHVQEERIRRDFAPYLRFCRSKAAPKIQKAFEQDVVDWLLTLGQWQRNDLKKQFFISPRLTLVGLASNKRLTKTAEDVAGKMLALFNLKVEG